MRKLVLRWVLAFFTIGLFSLSLQAQQPDILRFVPDDAVACFAFTGEIKPDANGTGFERWLAQPEIQESWQATFKLIEELLDNEDGNITAIVELAPRLPLYRPWVAFIESASLENAKGKFAFQLGDMEKEVAEAMAKVVDRSEDPFDEIQIDGTRGFSITVGGGDVLEFGIIENHLLIATGAGELTAFVQRQKPERFQWAEEILAELPLARTLALFKIDTEKIAAALPKSNGDFSKTMRFDEAKNIVGHVGYDGDDTVTRISMHCPQELTGFWKAFDASPITKGELGSIPESTHTVMGLKFSAETIWNLLLESSESKTDIDKFQSWLLDAWGIDFQEDVIQSFGDFFYSYQELSLINPMAGGVFAMRIRNPDQFRKRMADAMSNFEGTRDDWGLQIDETPSGIRYKFVPSDPKLQMILSGISMQLHNDELLMGLDPKAINLHLRRVKRDGEKLVDSNAFASLFDGKLNFELGQPIGIYYLDMQVFVEYIYMALPFIMMEFEQDPDTAGSGFDSEFLPPLETAIAGVRPNLMAVYRTERGFQIVERSTLPGVTTTTAAATVAFLPLAILEGIANARLQSQFKIDDLTLAILSYESEEQVLPPAYTRGRDKKPLLSWRVEILPYLDEQELYDEFHHDEPWDSPHNKALIEKMPDVFKHPSLKLEEGKTVYLGVAGKETVFSGDVGREMDEIIDGATNTLMLVEANRDHAVYWTQPTDFNVDELKDLVAALKGNYADGSIQFAFVDGFSMSARNLSDEQLRKLISINGGEEIDRYEF